MRVKYDLDKDDLGRDKAATMRDKDDLGGDKAATMRTKMI